MDGNAVKSALSSASVLVLASACHAANAAYCRSLGEDSLPSWDEAPEWAQASTIAGVEFRLANPDAGDSAQHENWMAARLADGWVLGEVKDTEKKTHPCLVPFDQLPPELQFKDVLFRTIIASCAPRLLELEATGERVNVELEAAIAERDAALEAATITPKASRGKAQGRKLDGKGAPEILGEEVDGQWVPREAMLLERIREAGTIEVAFSDGKRELGISPVLLNAEAFRIGQAGVQLALETVIVNGPARDGGRGFELRGYALLLDGKLAAWRDRDALTIPPGAQMNLAGDIVF